MEDVSYLRFVFALAFVLGLIGVLTLLARRFGLGLRPPQRRSGQRRLTITEIMPLDAKRRAVLIRRDDTEHLVILGPNGETLVEAGIDAPETFRESLQRTDPTEETPS